VKELINFALGLAVGYFAVIRAAPYLQAKLEAMDLDDMWDVYAEEWAGE
jgi:hypothetical protein